jgi:predicted HAD superfamily Cof-like phosphohydrolase
MYEHLPPRFNFDDVGDFHEKFHLDNVTHHQVKPREVPPDVLEFRINFMLEELGEFIEAVGGRLDLSEWVVGGARSIRVTIPEDAKIDHEKAFDSLIDLVYVAMGTAHFLGYPWQMGWRLVQRANMAKVRAKADASDSLRGHALDVVKPAGWTPPNIERLLGRFGWFNEGVTQ